MFKPAARVARPASRYWKGRPVQGETAGNNSSDEEAEDAITDARGVRKVALTEEEIARKEGMVIKKDITLIQAKQQQDIPPSDEEEESESEDEHQRKPVFKRPAPISDVPAVTAQPSQQAESEYETDSEEEESESEEEVKTMYKPVFVSKRNREAPTSNGGGIDPSQMTPEQLEELELKQQAIMEEERRQAHLLVAETVKRSLAEKEVKETFPDVDDTDGLEPAQEFEDWKLRELQRIKRDAEALYAREKEQEEVEARRALPEALRLKEDLARAASQREEAKARRGQQGILNKYHHKGAFYTDEAVVQRDTSGSVMENQVRDVASLPSIMQVRDYGKRSRTKHTHLTDVDTTSRDAGWSKQFRLGGDKHAAGTGPGGYANQNESGCFYCGQDGHMKRDCPVMAEESANRSSRGGDRRGGDDRGRKNAFGMDASERSRDSVWGKHGEVRDDRHLRQDRSRSRSRSPRRSRSRSRDRSMERLRGERDKRRRVD